MKVKMLHESGYIRCYDGENFYRLDNEELKAKVESPIVSNNLPFEGSSWDNLIFRALIDGMPMDKIEEFEVTYELEKEAVDTPYHILKFLLPDSAEFTGYMRLWIDKKTFLPQKMVSEFYFQGKTQYSKIEIDDLLVDDKNTRDEFLNFKIPDNYIIEYFSPSETSTIQLLSNETIAPNFTLPNLSGDRVSLNELRGKLVLIDFWYTSCYPCIKAMPYLEELHKKYQDKGLRVIGINPIDTNDNVKLNKFLDKNEITYSTLLGNPEMVDSYSIIAYPSLYLLDRNGSIVFSEIGFDVNTATTLDSIIVLGLED
jgi:thiol-disulfide isomerase/thioredoxin